MRGRARARHAEKFLCKENVGVQGGVTMLGGCHGEDSGGVSGEYKGEGGYGRMKGINSAKHTRASSTSLYYYLPLLLSSTSNTSNQQHQQSQCLTSSTPLPAAQRLTTRASMPHATPTTPAHHLPLEQLHLKLPAALLLPVHPHPRTLPTPPRPGKLSRSTTAR